MTRRRITDAMRVRVRQQHGDVCHLCGLPIGFKPWDVDHVTPLSFNGADDESNMRPAHRDCHRGKTAAEAPVRAKSNRVRARHLGARKSRYPMRGWRRFNGTPVLNPKLRS